MKTTLSLLFKLFILLFSTIALIFQSFSLASLSPQTFSPSFYTYSLQFDYYNINFANFYDNHTYPPFQQSFNETSTTRGRYYRLGYFGSGASNGNLESFQISTADRSSSKFQSDYYDRLTYNQLRFIFTDDNYNSLVGPLRLPEGLEGDGVKADVDRKYVASFVLMMMSAGFIGLTMIFTFTTIFTRRLVILEIILLSTLILSFISLLVSSSLVTQLNRFIISKFDDVYDSWGIKAGFGNAYFYIFIWIAVALELLLIPVAIYSYHRGAKNNRAYTTTKF